MKLFYFFILIILIPQFLTAQFAKPKSLTKHYELRKYEQDVRVNAVELNDDKDKLDSLIHALTAQTDPKQLQFIECKDTSIVVDTTLLLLSLSDNMSGQGQFTGTSEIDSVGIAALDSLDIVLATPYTESVNVNDYLSVYIKGNYLYVRRPAGGTTDLKYNWIWIRKYQ
ncbi:MAG: hypothetical protein PVH88_02155 [Ignavibacteria bacterium]|jgi:hypothetical protein